jgi:hypothetical protein
MGACAVRAVEGQVLALRDRSWSCRGPGSTPLRDHAPINEPYVKMLWMFAREIPGVSRALLQKLTCV